MKKAIRIHFDGIVQGVGFRPFVFRIATHLNIKGWVKNSSNGLNIHAEGEKVDEFLSVLQRDFPPLATITSTDMKIVEVEGYTDFRIVMSENMDQTDVLISPDIGTCSDCLQEMFDKDNRRYLYPFINCTNCGPRYTIIQDRPYDRVKTTMANFPLCPTCRDEYDDPMNRRFHAQPVACEDCGPALRLLDAGGNNFDIKRSVELLESGSIIAVKGLGGFHLVCDAYNDKAVKKLRAVKERGLKPFALMVRNLDVVSEEVHLSKIERNILSSPESPIVLLPRKNKGSSKISSHVAPNLHTLGIMLPYTPVHSLLLSGAINVLVMTSANLSGQPLIYENEIALRDLRPFADYFMVHDRDIFHPCDDSVIQVIGGKATFIRRARGYVPRPIFLQGEVQGSIAALGGEMKNAFCLASGKTAFMSQYIGDMHGYENFERFEQEFHSFQQVANIFPNKVGYDLHPEYATTKMAKQFSGLKCTVQHHHAHLVSVMEEYHISQPALGIICDGTGYGEDGRIWGFEFLYGNAQAYERLAHLEYLPLPSGDAGAKKPLRIAYAYLRTVLSSDEWLKTECLWDKLSIQERTILDSQLKSGFQLYETSSAGRLFDAVSALLDICSEVTYEGQAAIELESQAAVWLRKNLNHSQIVTKMKQEASERIGRIIAQSEVTEGIRNLADNDKQNIILRYNQTANKRTKTDLYSFNLDIDSGGLQLKLGKVFRGMVSELQDGRAKGEIAFRFHYSLACAMLETALIIGIPNRGLVIGGGVFQNKILTETLLDLAHNSDVTIYYPTLLPSGDGGLALGQILIANSCFD